MKNTDKPTCNKAVLEREKGQLRYLQRVVQGRNEGIYTEANRGARQQSTKVEHSGIDFVIYES